MTLAGAAYERGDAIPMALRACDLDERDGCEVAFDCVCVVTPKPRGE